jgi:hypothetical protein
MISRGTPGPFLCALSLMLHLLYVIFIHMCSTSSIYPSNAYNVTMVVNLTIMCFALSSPPRDLFFVFLVPILPLERQGRMRHSVHK